MARRNKTSRGKGTIESRGIGGQYRARIRIEDKRLSKTFETEQAAVDWLAAIRAAHRKPDRLTRTLAARDMTFAEALRKRLDYIKQNKNHSNEIYAVTRLEKDFPLLCRKAIYEIDEIDIQDFIDARSQQVAAATVNRDLCMISHTFNLARTKFGCTQLRNPIGPTTRLRLPRGRIRRLAEDEERAILAQAAEYELTSSIPIGSIIRFACATAMRCGEITGMRWENVDLNQGTVFLSDTKNGEARSVPLWLEMRAMLRDMGPRDSGVVWGGHEAVRSAWRRVRNASIQAAESTGNRDLATRLRNLRFHDFRHEGTSRLIERTGWDNARIQAITGHKTTAMLARYTHLRSADLAAQMAALEGGNSALRLIHRAPSEHFDPLPSNSRQRAAWQAASANKALLAAMVAVRPIRDIAADFGVSDVAVHKACDRLQIEKPGRGHWLRERNGKNRDVA